MWRYNGTTYRWWVIPHPVIPPYHWSHEQRAYLPKKTLRIVILKFSIRSSGKDKLFIKGNPCKNRAMQAIFSLSSSGPCGATWLVLMANMAADIMNDMVVWRTHVKKFWCFQGFYRHISRWHMSPVIGWYMAMMTSSCISAITSAYGRNLRKSAFSAGMRDSE